MRARPIAGPFPQSHIAGAPIADRLPAGAWIPMRMVSDLSNASRWGSAAENCLAQVGAGGHRDD